MGVAACAQIVGLGPERERAESGIGAGGAGGDSAGGGAGGDVTTPCSGRVEWARQFGNESVQYFTDAAPDAEGGVFVTGYFIGTLELDGAPLTSDLGADMYLARFDANGHHLWSRSVPDNAAQGGELHMAGTPDGGVVIAGSFQGTVDFGGGPLTAVEKDVFAASFDAAGNHLWSKVFGGPAWQGARAVAVDPLSGDVLLAGFFHQGIDFGSGPFTTPSMHADAFVAKLDESSGVCVWSRAFGGPDASSYANAVAVDWNGNVAFGGGADSSIDLGEGPLEYYEDGSAGAWIALYDSDGEQPIWTKMYDGPGTQDLREITFLASGDLIISGKVSGAIDLGGVEPVSTHPDGVFVAHLESNGEHVTSTAITGVHDTLVLKVDARDNVHLTGFFTGLIDPGGGHVQNIGGFDGLMLNLKPALDYDWSLHVGSNGDDGFDGIAISDQGGAFLLSTFRSMVSIEGCGNFQSAGESDLLLLKLRPF